ncbi:hypothetical protein N8083_02345, partial [Candidatus Pacebacteria bacterium]|nr:hypothetical protein [Candidatus Paceibacterota bacterium]
SSSSGFAAGDYIYEIFGEYNYTASVYECREMKATGCEQWGYVDHPATRTLNCARTFTVSPPPTTVNLVPNAPPSIVNALPLVEDLSLIRFEGRTRNVGNTVTPVCTLGVFWLDLHSDGGAELGDAGLADSIDETVHADDPPGTYIECLAPNTMSYKTGDWTNIVPGNHRVMYIADAGGDVLEPSGTLSPSHPQSPDVYPYSYPSENDNYSDWYYFTVESAPVDGQCGPAAKNYTYDESFPNGETCSVGTASGVLDPPQGGSDTWSCDGSGGGSSVNNCTATRDNPPPVDGQCGPAAKNYTTFEIFPQGATCSVGTASGVSDPPVGGSDDWTCGGVNGGNTPTCTATRSINPLNLTANNVSPTVGTDFEEPASITFVGEAENTGTVNIAEAGYADVEIDWFSDGPYDNYNAIGPGLKVGPLNVGVIAPLSHAFTGAIPVGTHRYRFNVDVVDEVTVESNESDNRSAWVTFTVSPAPPTDVTIKVCDLNDGPSGTSCHADTDSGNKQITTGTDLEVHWTSISAPSCAFGGFDGDDGDSDPTTGGDDQTVTPPLSGGSQTYSVVCNGVYKEVTVDSAASFDISIGGPSIVRSGSSVDLSWDLGGNDPATCTLTGPDTESVDLATDTGVTLIATNVSTYTLSCTSGEEDSVTVQVTPDIEEN